eukprot:COSAG02_NODE_29714_length_564_cov_1.004301_2_plen_26_part_01
MNENWIYFALADVVVPAVRNVCWHYP